MSQPSPTAGRRAGLPGSGPVRFLWFFSLALVVGGMTHSAQAQQVQGQFERAYDGYKTSMMRKEFGLWQRYTATYRQAITRNQVISRKAKWPDAMFELPFQLPEIATLTYLDALMVGNMANAVYYGKVDFGVLEPGEEIPENILILCFVQEGRDWKFDRTRFFNLSEEPEIRQKARSGDLTFLQNPQFRPTGQIPDPPKEIPVPDYAGDIWIASYGFETEVVIGDHHKSVVTNDFATELVMGGLWEDGRPITVRVRPTTLPEGVERRLEIGIYAFQQGKPAMRVWHWKPENLDAVPGETTSKVWANAVTMRGG